MPVGMQTSGGAAGNQGNNQSDAGFMANMKKFFTGDSDKQASADPWAAEVAKATADNAAKQPDSLDNYADLFSPKEDKNKAPQRDDPFAAVTRENLTSAAGNLDFSTAVDEATMTAALSGDANALRLAINQASRAAFVESTSASNTLMQKRVADAIQQQMPGLIKAELANHDVQTTVSSNPLLSNPATKPMRDMLVNSIRAANPNMPAAEVNKQLTGYLTAFATTVNSDKPNAGAAQRVGKAEEDAYNF